MPFRSRNAASNPGLIASRWVIAIAAAYVGPIAAQSPDAIPVPVDSIVATASRNAERIFDVPASIDRIDAATNRAAR
jgi:hypothetical protein